MGGLFSFLGEVGFELSTRDFWLPMGVGPLVIHSVYFHRLSPCLAWSPKRCLG